MAGKVVVVGSSNTDMILQMDHIPRPGETILGGEFSMAAGGKGANQAVAAARAGGDVTLLARVGDDMFGRQAVDGFVADGICVDHVIHDAQAPSGVALIFVAADGENSIGVASGANAQLTPADVEAAADLIASADVLVVQLETPLETVDRATAIAAAHDVRVILNPAPAQPLDDSLLSQVSVLTPNESEAELLTGIKVTSTDDAARAAGALRDKGIGTVIVTLGKQGALVSSDEFTGMVPAFQVDAVDTTAAGDVFNGALAVALAEGRPLDQAVPFAAAAAALSVTKLGAQPSAPSRQAIENLLASA
jgi:ribokinase